MSLIYSNGLVDIFGKSISDITNNVMDIGSEYPYSPERWRILVNDNYVFPEYNSVSQYNHNQDVHEIQPNPGETVIFQTAETPRYVVQYEILVSLALSINQPLQDGDIIKAGLFDGQNGWYFEHNSTHKEKEVDLVTLRNSVILDRSKHTLSKPLTDFTRMELRTAWYNVSRQAWRQTYSKKGQEKSDLIGKTSLDGQRGPANPNLNMRFEVTASSETSNLILNAGSVGYVVLGNTTSINRIKGISDSITINNASIWEPIAAFRIDPNRSNVYTQITDMEALKYTGNGDVKLLAQSFHKNHVGFNNNGWQYHPELSETNNVIQYRTDITSIFNNDGNPVSTTTNPGGYQLGRSILIGTGGNTKAAKVNDNNDNIKRELHKDSICVLLSYVTDLGDLTYELSFEQNF